MRERTLKILNGNVFYNLDYGQSKFQFEYFRIFISLFSIINFLALLFDHVIFLDPDGLISWEVTNASAFWFEPHLQKISNFINIDSRAVLAIFSLSYLTVLIFLLLGLFTRITSILCFIFFNIFSILLYPYQYGVDLYQTVFLLILCIFPSGYNISVSKKPRVLSLKLENQQQIGIRAIQLYLCLTYLSAGLGKAKMDSWYDGKFIFLSLSDPSYRLIEFPLDVHYSVFIFLGISVIFLELLYFILVLIPYFRTALIVGISLMHVFIAVFMGLIPFGLLLCFVNIIVWYPLIITDLKKVYIKP